MANVGYARVSTLDQDLSLQLDALTAAGCGEVFEDYASGAHADREGLRPALDYVRDGEVLVVWKLDSPNDTARIRALAAAVISPSLESKRVLHQELPHQHSENFL